MTGTSAFLVELSFVLVPLLILLAVVVLTVRGRTSSIRTRGWIAVAIFTAALIVSGIRLVRQINFHTELQSLDPNSIASINVSGVEVRDPSQIEKCVGALTEAQWYRPTASDGGWAKKVDVVIHLKSGEEQRYLIGRMLQREGAVVDFINQDVQSPVRTHYGYAYSRNLPAALASAGIQLPLEKQVDIR